MSESNFSLGAFRSTTKTRKTLKYGTCSIPFFSHQAKTIKSMYISMFILIQAKTRNGTEK